MKRLKWKRVTLGCRRHGFAEGKLTFQWVVLLLTNVHLPEDGRSALAQGQKRYSNDQIHMFHIKTRFQLFMNY